MANGKMRTASEIMAAAQPAGAGEPVGHTDEALIEIIAACDRHPLLRGFAHHDPTRQELQERIDTIRAIAKQAVEAAPAITDEMVEAVEEAVRQEREACALIANEESYGRTYEAGISCRRIAAAILARTPP